MINNIQQAQKLVNSLLLRQGRAVSPLHCLYEVSTMLTLENDEFVLIIKKNNGRILWQQRRKQRDNYWL